MLRVGMRKIFLQQYLPKANIRIVVAWAICGAITPRYVWRVTLSGSWPSLKAFDRASAAARQGFEQGGNFITGSRFD
jgi:hypothetical protein